MGYPAIWCMSIELELNDEAEIGLIEQVRATLFANITTSIVDDMFDGDEDVSVEHLGVLYLLIYGALIAGEWNKEFAPAAMSTFRQALRSARLRATGSVNRETVRIRGARIGAFFGLTGRACARSLGLDSDTETRMVNLLEDFGAVCGHVDDLLDFESDLARGDRTNVVALALGAHINTNTASYSTILRSSWGQARAKQFLEAEFIALAHQAETAQWPRLASRFRVAADNVFSSLSDSENV